jgi:hypothetical protein
LSRGRGEASGVGRAERFSVRRSQHASTRLAGKRRRTFWLSGPRGLTKIRARTASTISRRDLEIHRGIAECDRHRHARDEAGAPAGACCRRFGSSGATWSGPCSESRGDALWRLRPTSRERFEHLQGRAPGTSRNKGAQSAEASTAQYPIRHVTPGPARDSDAVSTD